jgi:hypothetical protein
MPDLEQYAEVEKRTPEQHLQWKTGFLNWKITSLSFAWSLRS